MLKMLLGQPRGHSNHTRLTDRVVVEVEVALDDVEVELLGQPRGHSSHTRLTALGCNRGSSRS